MFITFEGIDGAGKSSHIAAAAELFKACDREVVLSREPGGTPLGEHLRALTLNEQMDPLTEALLVFASRREHLRQVIEPALARGAVVISDRFTDSTFAYQGGGRGFDTQVLKYLEVTVQARPDGAGARQPDITLWFDLPPAVAAGRLAGARAPDKFEAMPIDFFTSVRQAYVNRMVGSGGRIVRINAHQPSEKVWLEVAAALLRFKGGIAAL